MNRTFVILVLASLLVQVLMVPILAFKLESRRAAIAATKCKNLDKPELQCAGSCYISMQLGKAIDQSQQDEPASAAQQTVSFPVLSSPPQSDWHIQPLTLKKAEACFELTNPVGRSYASSLWHPPRA